MFDSYRLVLNTTTGTNGGKIGPWACKVTCLSMVVLETEINEEHMESL